MKEIEDLRKALIKDFNDLYQPKYSANCQAQRLIRKIEINLMQLKHTMKLIQGEE